MILYGIKWNCEGSFQVTDIEHKLMQLDKAYNWFTAVCLEWKCVTGTIIETAESFYDEMKRTDKCTFSEGSNKKKLAVRTRVSIGTVW